MWRTYFTIKRSNQNVFQLSDVTQKIFSACDKLFPSHFSPSEQDIIRYYFTSQWRDPLNWKADLKTVNDYARLNNISSNIVWNAIQHANRLIIQEIGLLDKKGVDNDER